MAQRKFPTWATTFNPDIGNGDPNIVDPGATKQVTGWLIEKPLLQTMNWLQNLFGHFIKANNQVIAKPTGYEAEAGERVEMDNSSNSATLLLPTTPEDGQWVEVGAVELYSINPVIVDGGTKDIMVLNDKTCTLDLDNTIFRFWWDLTNSLWKIRITSSSGKV